MGISQYGQLAGGIIQRETFKVQSLEGVYNKETYGHDLY
jgi:hypothetical protein